MKRIVLGLVALFFSLSVYAHYQPWLEDFRDAVFGQNISISLAQSMFRDAERKTRENLSGAALYATLSRCEYLIGRVFQDHGRNEEAVARYEAGISLAEQSLAVNPTAEAYEMLSKNIGQLCMIKSNAWVMVNGLEVLRNAEKALELDNRNAGALYALASRWAFGPGAFGNPRRGITELQAMLDRGNLQKNDYFNVYSGLAYAHNRLNQNEEALSWIEKALALYPTNKFALDLKSQIQQQPSSRRSR